MNLNKRATNYAAHADRLSRAAANTGKAEDHGAAHDAHKEAANKLRMVGDHENADLHEARASARKADEIHAMTKEGVGGSDDRKRDDHGRFA